MGLSMILTIVAVVCFAAAALGLDARRLNLVAAGLFFWAVASLV